jgi:uncharacterized protein
MVAYPFIAAYVACTISLLACASSGGTQNHPPPVLACKVASSAPRTLDPAAKAQDIEQLLKTMHFEILITTTMNSYMTLIKTNSPHLPPEFFDSFSKEFTVQFVRELILPLYDRTFTQAEIVAMNDFYSTDVGQAVLQKMPALMNESMQKGATWGLLFAQRAANEWQKSHMSDK